MNKNSGIQGLRAIAASLVLLQHGIYFACVAKGVDFQPYLPIGFGGVGVGIFFVISGYVMTLCLPQGKMFMVQRIARVYPAYWIAVVLSGLVLPLLGRPWSLDFYSLSLLPASSFNENYAIPYWTLIYEMVFYGVMYASILIGMSRKYLAYALTIWAFSIVITCQSNVHPGFSDYVGTITAGKWILLSPNNFMFIAGALYGLIGQDVFKKLPPLSLSMHTATIFFISQANIAMPFYFRFLMWGIAYVSVLDLVRSVRMPVFMERAGDYSYGLYLTHTIFIHVAMYVMVRFSPSAPLTLYFAMALGVPLVGGLAFGAMEFRFHASAIKAGLRRLQTKSQV